MNDYLLISDAAKEVKVESHVLRYWEEELHLPIKRNELGHRYYTREDVERFKQIKNMKERGLQLKAIKMILKDGELNVVDDMQQMVPGGMQQMQTGSLESKEEKTRRLQWLLQQLIRETLQENNEELSRLIRESVVKELDYQFRLQEERDEERNRILMNRGDEYYQKMDELLRSKSKKAEKERRLSRSELKNKARQNKEQNQTEMGGKPREEPVKGKKKRHSFL